MNRKLLTILLALFVAFGANAQKVKPESHSTGRAPFGNIVQTHNVQTVFNGSNAKGIVSYAWNAYGGSTAVGPITIEVPEGTLTSIAAGDPDNFMAGADLVGDVWYAVQYGTNNLVTIDKTTGALTTIANLGIGAPTGLAYDALNDVLYLSDHDNVSSSRLWTVNKVSGAITLVGTISSGIIIGIACDNTGNLYGIDIADDLLYTINTSTGAPTAIGSTGLALNYAQDLAYDRDNDILYGALYTSSGGLYIINTSTGACTLSASFAEEVDGFAIPYTLADPSAPAAPTAFTAVPDAGGALTVQLDWTNPTLDVSGVTLTELTSIDVYLDADPTPIYTDASPVIGGTDSYEATVTGGEHTFRVVGTNSYGPGLAALQTVFVGVDVEVLEIILPAWALVNDNVTPGVTVINNGVGTQTFDVVLTDGNGYSETVTATDLASGSSVTLDFPTWSTSSAGTVTFTATASDPGTDVNLENNEMMADLPIFGGCEHTLVLVDAYGDGWNGNTCSVMVNGAVALDNITLESGTGPETFSFFAETGDDIQFDFWANGSWIDECSWEMFDGEGTLLFSGGNGTVAVTEYTTGACGGVTTYDVTFNVDMTVPIAAAEFIEGTDQLWVGGSMNTWTQPGVDPLYEMTESATNDFYTLTVQLADGDYAYKYFKIVGGTPSWDNGEWTGDPNRVFTVEGADVTLDDIWATIIGVNDLTKVISIYPNPSNGLFNVTSENTVNLNVYDITGKMINTQIVNGVSTIQINNAGVYFFKFSNEEGSSTQRVIVK